MWIRRAIGVGVLVSGAMKLAFPAAGEMILPYELYVALAGGEIILGITLVRRSSQVALMSVMGLAGAGVVAIGVSGKQCGCLGRIALSPAGHMVLAAVIGASCAFLLAHGLRMKAARGCGGPP
jgi:hypothetical protein